MLADIGWLRWTIAAVRNIRAKIDITLDKPLELLLYGYSADAARRVSDNRSFLLNLTRSGSITVLSADNRGPVSMTEIIDGAELSIPVADLIDKEDELARLVKEVTKIEGEIARIEGELSNEGPIARTPEAVIIKKHGELDGYTETKARLVEQQAVIVTL